MQGSRGNAAQGVIEISGHTISGVARCAIRIGDGVNAAKAVVSCVGAVACGTVGVGGQSRLYQPSELIDFAHFHEICASVDLPCVSEACRQGIVVLESL